MSLRETVFDRDVLALNIASFAETLPKSREQMRNRCSRRTVKAPDHWYRWLRSGGELEIVQNQPWILIGPMSQMGQTRKSGDAITTSAFPPTADTPESGCDVRKVPFFDHYRRPRKIYTLSLHDALPI